MTQSGMPWDYALLLTFTRCKRTDVKRTNVFVDDWSNLLLCSFTAKFIDQRYEEANILKKLNYSNPKLIKVICLHDAWKSVSHYWKIYTTWLVRSYCARSLVVTDLHSETKGSRFESGCYVQRGELSAVISRLMSKCLLSGWKS